jgi:hypothetical protein
MPEPVADPNLVPGVDSRGSPCGGRDLGGREGAAVAAAPRPPQTGATTAALAGRTGGARVIAPPTPSVTQTARHAEVFWLSLKELLPAPMSPTLRTH